MRPEAQELLNAAAQGDGYINRTAGIGIIAGGEPLVDSFKIPLVRFCRYWEGVDELLARGYIRPVDAEQFQITAAGVDATTH